MGKIRFFVLVLAFACLLSRLASQQIIGHPIAGDTMYVFSSNGLNMREGVSIKSKIVSKLPHSEMVVVLADKMNYRFSKEINSRNGFWLKCKSEAGVGYLFSAYLSKYKPPSIINIKENHEFYYKELLENWLRGIINSREDTLISKEYIYKMHPMSEKTLTRNSLTSYQSGSILYENQGWEWSQFKFVTFLMTINDFKNFDSYYESTVRDKYNTEGYEDIDMHIKEPFVDSPSCDYCPIKIESGDYNSITVTINYDLD